MLSQYLEQQLLQAVRKIFPDVSESDIQVKPCPNPKFGDYQSASIMALGKKHATNPRALAAQVIEHLDVKEASEPAQIAGAGFINFKIHTQAYQNAVHEALAEKSLFLPPASAPRRYVIDFSSPNVAKSMHVGHIRSTILGDCLARVLRLLGHDVVTDNHIGDWGTQFGKLIVGWKRELNESALASNAIEELERLYKSINAECEDNADTLEEARRELVKLQHGDPENRRIWERMIELSREHFDSIYQRLGVEFDRTLGESFYNDRLRQIVDELVERGIAEESQGAKVVFFPDAKELKDHPALIQKSDGAANYTTTDLATLAYRLEEWRPDDIVYVTDGRQQLHFKQLFAIFKKWRPDAPVKLSHVWFGSIQGEDGKPFKTRSGETVKLNELLDEAEERTFQIATEKNPDLNETDRREIARVIGLGAVKYADLLPNRQTDYVFNWNKMLSLTGNTAPYLLYAHTRIRSLFRNAGDWSPGSVQSADEINLETNAELHLVRHLVNFGLVLNAVADEFRPNYLCNYLYDLAGFFARFWESCPVLKTEPRLRQSRLALSYLTGEILRAGLNALGIRTTEKM